MEGQPKHVLFWHDSISQFLEHTSTLRLCLVFTSRLRTFRSLQNFGWKKISHHKQAGGATCQSYQVAFWPNDAWRMVEAAPSWNLKDLVDVTRSGKSVDPPEDPKNIFLRIKG